MSILETEGEPFELTVPVVVVGARACGLCAALAAHDTGTQAPVLEAAPLLNGHSARTFPGQAITMPRHAK